MNSMIKTRQARLEGISFKITLHQDDDSLPTDFECYEPADLADWRDGRWTYVGVTVETTFGYASIWGVEYGRLAGKWIGMDSIIADHGRDLLAEAYDGEVTA